MPASIAARLSEANAFAVRAMSGVLWPAGSAARIWRAAASPSSTGRAVAPKMLQRDAAADFVVFREKNVDAFELRRRIAHEMVCGTGLPALRQQPCQKACGAHGFTSQPSKR
jgi:hypothetical protein